MDRSLVLLVVGLLALTAPATATLMGATPAPDAPDAADRSPRPAPGTAGTAAPDRALNGTPNRLSVGSGTVVAGYDTPNGDLAATVGMGDGDLRAQFRLYDAVERVQRADTARAKRRAIHTALDGIERRVADLRARERRAVRAYHNGSATRRELLRSLARIHVEAAALRASIERFQGVGGNVVDAPLDRRLEYIDSDLETFQTPVRERIAAGLRAASQVGRVHVAATQNGVVLETIDDGQYHRDAVRFDNYDPTDADRYDGIGAVTSRIRELYPWASAEQTGFSIDPTASQLYVMAVPHPQGTTLVYLDGGTGNVYREVQRLRLSRLPTSTVENATDSGIRVRVNATPGGTPIRVSVVDASTGDPVDAVVRIEDRRAGRTGEDGTLWALGTRGTYTVSVDARSGTVTVTLSG